MQEVRRLWGLPAETKLPHRMFHGFLLWCLGQGFLLIGSARPSSTQTQFEWTPEVGRLLRESLDKMYQYDLKGADQGFDELVRRFPNHPIGPMHKAEVVWWRALRDNKNQVLEEAFDHYTALAVNKGKNLLEQNPDDFYALLYLAAAYGNQTRYHTYIEKSYYQAMRAGIKGYDFIRRAHAIREHYVDCLIGEGAYNYFAGSLPGVIKFWWWMFGSVGNKAKGIQQLETAAETGEYGRVAAKTVLLGVYYNEKRFDDHQRLLASLIGQYPSNPVFVTWLADFYVRQGRTDEGIQSLTRLERMQGEQARSSVALAQIHFEKGRLELAQRAADQAVSSLSFVVELHELSDDPIIANSYLLRGNALDLKGSRELAVADYQTVLRLKAADETHSMAKKFLARPYRANGRP